MRVPAVEPPIVVTLAIALVWLVLQGGGGIGAFLLGDGWCRGGGGCRARGVALLLRPGRRAMWLSAAG